MYFWDTKIKRVTGDRFRHTANMFHSCSRCRGTSHRIGHLWSVGGSIGAGTTMTCSGLQGAGVGPAHDHSLGRDTGCSEEQQADVVVPQEVTSGRRRPKWLHDTLREA